jgi:superfamily II DNA or RNA helicase
MTFAASAVDLSAIDLREAQSGALHAVVAHQSATATPAQVVLPTGVGKTLIATLMPYVLQAERVLVVTPARIIRDQVAHSFKTLSLPKNLKAIDSSVKAPDVVRADHRCTTAFWHECLATEVVVGTPQVLSHGYSGVDPIPDGLFDLVIFDEAHHLPAPTWSTLHAHLEDVPTVLLTATPFRADQRRLPGEIAYAYPLRRAIEAGAYQPVRFLPLDPLPVGERDEALARAVAERLSDPSHQVAGSRALVRTNRKDHADELVGTYAKHGLNLATVLDRTSGFTVRRLLAQLNEGSLDGLIVVGAMTEGFDFPAMKVAAYHHPHRTLAATLQFVGRLSRVGDVQGELIAFPEDVSGETAELFREDAAWETLLPDIVDSAVASERRVRTYTSGLTSAHTESQRVSALALAPPRSTHIFRVADQPDFSFDPSTLAKGDVIERFRHDPTHLVAFITRHRIHPRFMREDVLDSVEHHLHIATWIEDPGLLFISSDLPAALKAIRSQLSPTAKTASAKDLARLLAAADLERCFSVGARAASSGTAANESYRTLSGPRAEQSISLSDARARVLGHVMGRMGGAGAGSGTFGFSSKKGKLWEPTATQSLLDFREWCEGHADVLRAAHAPDRKDSPLYLLNLPDTLSSYPDAPALAVLPPQILADPREFRINNQPTDPLATDVACRRLTPAAMELTLTAEKEHCVVSLDLSGEATLVAGKCELLDTETGEIIGIAEFLDEHPVTLIFGDGSWVFGDQIVDPPSAPEPLPAAARVPLDWTGTPTAVEFVDGPNPTNCVAGKTLQLLELESDWIIQDHLRGELADFVCVRENGNRLSIDLVHCKATKAKAPGCRPTDIQELLAQALRSMYLATAGPAIWVELMRRINERAPTKVIKGVKGEVLTKLQEWSESRPLVEWQITVSQPGVADDQLDSWEQGNALFVAAYDTCKSQGVSFRLVDAKKWQ